MNTGAGGDFFQRGGSLSRQTPCPGLWFFTEFRADEDAGSEWQVRSRASVWTAPARAGALQDERHWCWRCTLTEQPSATPKAVPRATALQTLARAIDRLPNRPAPFHPFTPEFRDEPDLWRPLWQLCKRVNAASAWPSAESPAKGDEWVGGVCACSIAIYSSELKDSRPLVRVYLLNRQTTANHKAVLAWSRSSPASNLRCAHGGPGADIGRRPGSRIAGNQNQTERE